jgi:transcriptional regulator with XRE-family HTH domain
MRAETDPRVLIPIARETGGAEVPAALDPGALVRDLRKARGLTLDQAAAQAGLARSTLSKIENGQMSPTCDVLRRLAEGLAISTPQLFTPPTRAEVTGRMAVTREGRGVAHATATWEHALLSATLSRRKMLPCRARIRARSMDAFDVRVRHDGGRSSMPSPAACGCAPRSANRPTLAPATAPVTTRRWGTTRCRWGTKTG